MTKENEMKFTLAVPYDWRDVRLSFPVAAYALHDGVRLHVKVNPECIDYSDKDEMSDAVVYRTAHGTRVRNLQQFNSMFLDIYEEFKIREFDCELVLQDYLTTCKALLDENDSLHELLENEAEWYLVDLPNLRAGFEIRQQTVERIVRQVYEWGYECMYSLPEYEKIRDVLGLHEYIASKLRRYPKVLFRECDSKYVRGYTKHWAQATRMQTERAKLTFVSEVVDDDGSTYCSVQLESGKFLPRVEIPAAFLKEFLDGYELFQDNHWIEFSYLEKNSRGKYRSPMFFRFVLW